MPNKVTYTITTADGKEHQVSKENVDKYGIQSYADAYKGATIRMRDAQKGDYDIPLQHFDNARKQGLHAFSLEHTPVQKQAAPKPTPTPTAKPTPSPSVHPRQSTPQVSKPLLSDSFGKGTGTDFLKPKPVGYNISEEHRNEVLGEQARRSTTPSNPHVQHAVQLGNEAKTKRVEREQKRFGKPTIAKAFDDAVHGDKKAAKELGMPQVMQQKKDEIDYMQATGKELRNPVDAGLTYDENGDVVHSMFAPTVARDEHGNIVTNEAGEPLVGISSDEARAKAYGDSVQTGIEAQREKDKVDNLYKDAAESVNDAFDEDYKKKEAFRKEHPFLGAVSDALEGFSNRGNALQYTPEGAKPGLAALGMLSKAAIAKNNADRYGDAGTLSRLYGGIMAGLTDVDTYDFGITDTFNAANLYRAAKNYEEGKATAKDKMLLDAAAIANNVQSEASDKLGGAFGAGQNLVGTIGFMAQMATNPASGVGKEAAASVAKTVAKRALQKFGKGAIAKAVTGLAKGAARVGMDAVEAGVVTGMYSPTKIVGDYLNRKTGDVQSDGKGGYIFQNKEYSDVKALAKAINGQYAENISEMWGEYLPGVSKVNAAISRGARKIGLGKVVDAFEHMSSSNWAKTWKNFQERTKWNGMAGEYFEEVANNLYNAVTNGDMTLDTDPHTGVFNPKINLDTFYSVALMSGIMSGVNTAGYARERYKAPHEQRKADAQARSVFGERWDEYKNAIDNADEKQIGSVMEKIGSDKSLSNSQKIAALQYQYRTAVVHGVNAQDTKNKLEGQFNAMDEAYSMGYNLQDEKELNNTAILYDEAKKQATKATGWGEDTLESMIGEDGGVSTLAYMKHSDEFNDGQLQAFTDYANARAAYNGMIQRVKDDIDTKVHESELVVDQRTNLDTGAIHPATMKVDDRQVYIVNGNVVMLPDGSGVDHEHSDDFVVLRDAETGELETADPSAIFKVDAPINVQEEKEVAADNIRQTFAQQQADKIDGKLEFKQGDTYSIIDKEDGTQHSLSIIGDAIDEKTGQVNPEMVLVDIDGAQQPILLPKEQVQQQVDEARRAAVAATQVVDVENTPTTNTNNTYSINDEVTLSDENGNTVRGSITAPENEDGKFEVYTEQPINGKKVNLFSAEELDAMTKAPETVTENATVQQPQQQEETEDSVEKETSQQQTTALERIPKDESGQPLYEQTEPETAWDAIVEQTEGDTSMAQTVADDMVSDLEAGVKKAEKTKTKSGGSIAEKIAAEKERAAVIEQAKATLAHWRKIAAVNRMREAAIQAEEQRKADEVARVRKEQEEKERVEQEEAERIKREALNGVPDFVEDKATDARARGYRRVNGDKVDRQEPINATKGKEVQVKFDDDNIPTGHVAIIEANQLQPSHKNGQRNPQHFIDEAQPKERKDDASVGAARKIAANIRPEEITSSITAYTGAPTVNSRGEVIQGNNRSAALREMWDNHQEQGDKYKQYLIDHAESFGLRPEDIAAMDKPVLVNMLDVNDDEAISLGQFVASDTESGGTERIKPKNVVKKLGDKMKNFANILLRANDENISFAELVDSNGVNALKWLNANGVISPTQYKSAFDSKGNITAEAKNDIKGIMYQSIFEGGNTQLEEMFNTLPAKAQKAILATAYRDYDSPQSERMIGDIQDSIMAYYALSHDSMFMNAKNHKDARIAVEAWRRQLAFDDVTGESYLPAEKYSNFALLLATMYKGDNQSLIQGTFNKMYDLIQGTQEETLFEQPDNTPRSLAQAIKETLNIEYNGQQGSNVLAGDNSASQEGRTGSNGDATSRGRSEDIDGAEANQGGTERDSGRSGEKRVETVDEGAYSLSQQKSDNGENFYQDINGNIDLANIPDEVFNKINKPQAPFRLTPSMLKHVFDRHGKEMGLSKADDAIDFVLDVIDNFDHVRQGEKGAIIFSIENGRSRTGRRAVTVLLDSLSGSYYGIKTSGYERIEGLAKRTLLWEKGAKDTSTTGVAPANVSTVQASQSNEQAGSASNHNNDFEGKDKQSSDTKQEIVDNYLEKPTRDADLFAMAERVAEEDKAKRTRKKEEAKVDTNPTEAQKEAGNYKKGHIKVDGFNVTIEQPKGSVRRGKDANGKEWETEMHNTYGYIRGTESVDGDHIDIFLSDNPTEGNVFVVDQVNKDGSFDEHKVMYGFSDMESARKAYLSNYEEGWQGLGNITEVSKEEFKKWIDSSKRKTKPFAEYTSVKTEGDVNVQHPIEDKGGKRLVSNERYEELKKRMRSKLGQLNLGVDPEMLAIGAEMAVYHIENGARAFGAYAKEMISDLGDAIRPYLKAFYNGARDLPEMAELSKDMTPYDEVSRFNVATIGNEGEQLTPSAIETAKQINNEATVEFNAKQEQNNTNELEDVDNDAYSITKQHNNKKDVDIWVVRGKERTDKDVYTQRKQVAKEHNGYYSSFRGVNGFVFNTAKEAHAFADVIFNTQSEVNPAQNLEEDIVSKGKTTDHNEVEEPTESSTNSRLLAQYNVLKEKYPDTKILLRVGDFYETYQDDAKDLSKTLGIVLTKRNDGINVVGFPDHSLDNYLPKLIRAGYRVAINDKDETANDTPTSNGLEGRFTSAEDIEGIFGKTFVNDETGTEIKVGHFTSPYKVAIKLNGQVSIEEWRHLAKTLNKEGWQEKIVPDLHGFNIGDKVMYKGKEATLYDIDRSDNNRPILDTGLAPVMYDVANWDELTPVANSNGAIAAKEEKVSTEKEKPAKKNNSKKKDVSLEREPTVGDLFDNNDLDSKDNDTARTRQAESSSRENGTVGSISTERDGVLDTRSTGTADGEETARVSDAAGTVADGERKELLGQRSSRSTSGGNHGDGEAERPLSERGQRIGDRDDANGRSAIARATDESQRTPRSTAGTSEQLVHGEARRGGRGRNVASAKQPEPKFKRNYLYPENSSEVDNMTPQQRLRSNVEALEVVRTLMKEGREATADERDVLGRYRGWGGVDLGRAYSTDMMRGSSNGRWGTQTENDKLLSRLADIIDELDPDGKRGVLSAINRAALTSYYTPTAVAKTLNDFVELAGFKGGNMLDPSMGSGIFEGTMSKAVQQRTMIHGIELDWLTGQIARNLYPDANVLVTGYEQVGTADNAYDVVMSNIPFGDLSVTDKTWKHDSSPVRKAAQNRIHNYFAVKMLDNTRSGGLCVIMTSNAILDTKSNQIIREHLADKAEVLGVVRLPDNTFKGAGTSVVTDVILLRKYKNEADRIATRGNETYTTNIEKPFLSSGELQLKNPTDGKTYNVTVNGYFTKNKDMMIGDGKAGGQYRADEFGLSSTMSTDEIAKSIRNLVEKKIVADRKGKLFDTHKTEREVKQAVSEAYKGDGNYISSGNIVEQDGMIGVVTSTKNKYGDVTTTFNEIPSLKGKAERIEAMLPIRRAMKQLIDMQIQGVDNNHLEEARTELQNTYDAFVKKYGRLNDKANDFLTEDIDGYTLRSLEKYKDSKFIGLSDIFTKNTIKPALDMTTAKTPQDAISLSLAEYGEIKPSFMKDVLGENWTEQCGDILFKTPFTEDEYETVDAYLSGDVKTKLEQARAAAKEDATLQRNIDALEAVQPKDIPFEDISIRMGARWIPAEVYTDFMYEQFGIPKYIHRGNKSGVEYLPEVDQYVVNVDKKELGGEADAWRTSRRSASEVFTAALQDKSLSVFDTIKEGGKETKVLNKEETELLNNKIQDLRTAFEDWIGQNPEREEMLMRLYNDKFNRTVLRKFDGSHLNVAGLMGKELRPHQKDAVWMLINNCGGIVDHIVGAGKTLVMQSAIMEMRRMGIAKKPMIIALKSTVAQIAKEFREAYPAARILAPTEKDFAANNRKKFMAQIALNDYDCVILSHDQYNMLPHTEEVERSVIDEQMAQLDNAIEFLYGQDDKSQLTKKQIKGLEKRKNNLETKLTNLLDRKIDREFTFEGLGVDYLFVDECQHFKSLPYVSTYDRVAGLGDKKGSQKSIALLNGVRYLQKMHQGDQGTVFLSGTTISNSLSEIYHLLNYLRPSEMERLGMTTFDAWAGNFAIHTAELEYGVTSELKEKDRFRSLTNIPELAKMYAEIADVRNDMNLKLPKPKMRSHIVTVPQTDLMQEINREIVNMVKNKDGDYFNIDSNENTPWGLLASTYSAKAAINPRLIDESWESEGGKIPAVCENVKKIYDQFAEQKGTQLIFCDTGVPGKGKKYDAYSDIINRLVNDYGIPRKEIADIHEANTDEKRKELFAKVNDGSVRILIGGTKNMGTGVNVQKRIVAMHHVDVPWTPADREQREGRGVRQGNEIARDFNDDNVDVYFYATEGSLDMYKYQLQETKGKLFAQFKSGTIGDRTFDEGDAEENFDPAEVVAMLSGNPVIFEKSKQDKKVEKLRRAKRAYESDWQRRHARYEELQTKKRNYERLLSLNASDVQGLERGGFTADAEGKYPSTVTVSVKDDYSSRKTFDKPKEAGAYIHELLKQNKRVQLSGFQQTANISIPITDAGLFGKPVAELESYGGIKYAVEVSDDDTAAGVSFRNLLQKVYNNRKVYERNIEDVNNQLKGADPGENIYPKQAELDEALKEKRRLDEEYKKLSEEEEKPSTDDDTMYRVFGGNKGYVGYSMSKRAARARAEGRYPKTDFKKEYGLTENSLIAMADIGMIETGEWHHTSMYGNRTTFYGWAEPWMGESYAENKKEIDRLSREKGVDNSDVIEALMDESRAHRDYISDLEEEKQRRERMAELHDQYIREMSKPVPEEIEVSSGAVVHTEEKEWYVTMDGVRLTKRNGKHLRNEAIAEAKEMLKADVTFEEWLQKQNDSLRYRDFDGEVNEQFNRELAELTEENADTKIFNLGSPSLILLSAGVENKPMKLYGNKVIKKMKKHGFALAELEDLPKAVANPIAVFNNYQREGNRTILTELRSQEKNIMVAVTLGKNGVDVDFNIVSSVFGKGSTNIVDWISKGYLAYVDKEKALNYLYFSKRNISEAADNPKLSSTAKIVKDFENPNIDEEKLRDGYGSYTNGELSFINDPVAKLLGKSNRTEEDHKAFAERERQRMISRVSELADKLHLDNIETVTDSNSLQGKKAKAKGFYSKSSGKITIVIPNHASVEDVEKTLLHEAVAHYGLRKLFGEHFETFLDNVYQNVEPEIRRIITSQAANNNWDFRTATEEYLAGLAERTDFERVHYAIWNKIKSLFLKMLHSIGFEGWSATELSDNELRYLLWRSYENMKEPGRYRSILGEAEDIAKQNELKVGNYDQQDTNSSYVAESKTETENTLYRQGSNGQSAYDIYENAVKDSGTQTMLGALARTVFSKDARTRFKNKFAESYFDYSRSIKQLQDAIEDSLGVKLDSYEDVWRTLNAKGSADAQEVNLAMLRYIAPLAEHIGYMIKGKSLNGEALTLDDVEKYMNAVHGIERNKHMQEAAFRDKLIKKLKSEGYSNEESEAIAEAELDNIRKGNGSMYMDIYDNARKDYSGLTALFGDEVKDVDNIDELEAAATQYANDFGKTVGMDKTLELWDKVRALNNFSLRKSYLSGLISKAQYEGVKRMFQYYVPLRGWHEGAAGDIYEYISRGERAGMLESALKVAKGRKSRAGDILGTMAAMVNTAIVQGNKNLVAQKFLNMALNYGEKSGLLMVGKQWYEESANEELIPLFPHLHDGMTLQEQQDEIERFEKDMEQKRKTGKVRELRRGFHQEVGLRMPKWQEQEHCVRVMRNGREHQVYVLGNPRAAQAFNGLLNKQAKSDLLTDGWAALMRAKATMQTSLSPEFIFSNFQRDILTAGTGTYIKFGRKAGVEFAKNLTMLNPMAGMNEGRTGGIFTLIYRYNKGTLDMSNEVERMFDEFVRNGGMTGVSVIEGKDEYQKSINKAVKRIKQGKLNMGRQAIHGLADAIEFMNSGVENSTRFAAYMVSRKTLGKSVTESVFDAKEASVNFNMKGSGAWLNLWMRRNIMYANPAIQSLRMLGTWYEASPKRFMGVLSTIIATSVTMAMLWASIGAGNGDDDNDWYKLSEWNRYNYLNVWTGNGYAHWSLPQEFRPVWALGQIVFDWQRGMVSEERAINSMMTQLNNLSPMAFFSGGMDSKDSYWKTAIRAWTPTIAADFADAYVWNENFLGQKITNQEDYNIDSPEFQRAGKNTPHWAVSLSKQWNNGTGGAENRKSYWDSPALNPSALYYLAQQQLGGLGTMVTKLSKAYEQLEDPNGELEAKNIPFVSKVWVSTEDKQSKNRVTDDKFWIIYNDWKLIDSEMKHNKSDVEKGKMSLTDLAERMNELQQNGDHKRWARLRGYMKGYDELRKARNNGADVEEAMDELKKDVVKEEEKTLTSK